MNGLGSAPNADPTVNLPTVRWLYLIIIFFGLFIIFKPKIDLKIPLSWFGYQTNLYKMSIFVLVRWYIYVQLVLSLMA